MRTKFTAELSLLDLSVLQMGASCEEALHLAYDMAQFPTAPKLKELRNLEETINGKEHDIENRALHLLLKEQPVAKDLKKVSATMKVISDLERIGDQALDIGGLAEENLHLSPTLSALFQQGKIMLADSLDSFLHDDDLLAKEVIMRDETTNRLFLTLKEEIVQQISEDRSLSYLNQLMVGKYLERICDHTKNIAEATLKVTGR